MTEEQKAERDKCEQDVIYFMEKYCTINGQPIVINEYGKAFIRANQKKLNRDQLQAVVYAFTMADKLKHSKNYIEAINEFLDKFPNKKHNINFAWNLRDMAKDNINMETDADN